MNKVALSEKETIALKIKTPTSFSVRSGAFSQAITPSLSNQNELGKRIKTLGGAMYKSMLIASKLYCPRSSANERTNFRPVNKHDRIAAKNPMRLKLNSVYAERATPKVAGTNETAACTDNREPKHRYCSTAANTGVRLFRVCMKDTGTYLNETLPRRMFAQKKKDIGIILLTYTSVGIGVFSINPNMTIVTNASPDCIVMCSKVNVIGNWKSIVWKIYLFSKIVVPFEIYHAPKIVNR
eukprot:CAMPEP_0184755188 /NCGR_PEP_ID=MMETSP0315-20130426/45035_1 /TAXON_ID=101924 /ORGANISM="Rhodosorus marinus, Strain UTEX LB 2760" /LENGTH=238 /DNA_ID=CAMNT_0027234683 /DNA_START=507 /DNA_END=1223 /DNA_ORIENTATION=-